MLHVKQLGQAGKDVVLLHGWGRSLECLFPLGQILAQNHRVYLIDLPGFGKSTPPEQVWGSSEYAERIYDWMQEERISKASFLGHSFGGKVAATLAAAHPNCVEELILCASAGIPPKFSWRRKGIQLFGKGLKAVSLKRWQEWFVPRFASQDYCNAGAMRNILVRSVNEDLQQVFREIQTKTTIVWGESDRETPLYMGKRIHQLIQGSTLITLPHHGHDLFESLGHHLVASCLKGVL